MNTLPTFASPATCAANLSTTQITNPKTIRTMPIPCIPDDPADLKTWSPGQLEHAAPFWVKQLEAWMVDDDKLIAQCPANSQLLVDALGIKKKHQEQLTYWKLIQDGIKTYRTLPPSLRTYYRASTYTECGWVKRGSRVGDWSKACGIPWAK